MGYFAAKSDERFILGFYDDVMSLWDIEGRTEHQYFNSHSRPFETMRDPDVRKQARTLAYQEPSYGPIREKIARALPRAQRVAKQCNMRLVITSPPPPGIAGRAPTIRSDALSLILNDTTYPGIERGMLKDSLDQIIGASNDYTEKQRLRLVNPIYWAIDSIAFALRVPFLVLEAAGINGGKYEASILGKMFKLGLLIGLVVFFGLKSEEVKRILLSHFR